MFSGQGHGHVTLKLVWQNSKNDHRELRLTPLDRELKMIGRLNEEFFSMPHTFAARGT